VRRQNSRSSASALWSASTIGKRHLAVAEIVANGLAQFGLVRGIIQHVVH